jgi:hypothetical protein
LDCLESLLSGRIARVTIGVMLSGELTIGSLDFCIRSILADAEDAVGIL